MATPTAVPRPQRWDMPFSREGDSQQSLTNADVDRILNTEPFSKLNADGFKRSLPLRDIIKNDVRLVNCEPGDIVIRKGDWGQSAFFVLNGAMHVELEPPESSMPDAMLGRRSPKRKTWLQTIAQLWSNHSEPEFREPGDSTASTFATRELGDSTRIYLPDVSAVLTKYRTARLDSGQWFGELAALGRTQRLANVFAETKTELLEIRWQGLRDIMRHDRAGELKQYIEGVFRERALAAFLRNEPLFQDLSPDDLSELTAGAEFASYGNYDSSQPFKELAARSTDDLEHEPIVATEGEQPHGIILVRSGLARMSERHHHGHRTIGYLNASQSFGVAETTAGLKSGVAVPYRYSLRAIGFLNVVVIPMRLVEKLHIKQQAPPPSLAAAPARRMDDHLLDFLVDGRFVQGTSTMVIDMDRCTRCDDCVRACAETHDNNPRFVRHGPMHGRHMLVNACMHCADPVCMIECPTGAIYRDIASGLVVINERTCIGCAQCANNCPFDAIRMVEIRDSSGRVIVDERNARPLVQATKCDLCTEQLGGPACERACPQDALFRVDMRDLDGVRKAFRT
ncbi:MAG: 4Fe-4S dicluster domain-containing protein [Planctomycetota bacterium]|nr:4Fe-4S dicluster domain-containing protein [Planctomycetota bacterium]